MTHISDDTKLIEVARLLAPYAKGNLRRLALMLYLVDWRCAITAGHQATAVRWTFEPRGPMTEPVELVLEQASGLRSGFGSRFLTAIKSNPLEGAARAATAHVIATVGSVDDLALHRLVLSTWPVITQDQHDEDPDLVALAHDYAQKVPA